MMTAEDDRYRHEALGPLDPLRTPTMPTSTWPPSLVRRRLTSVAVSLGAGVVVLGVMTALEVLAGIPLAVVLRSFTRWSGISLLLTTCGVVY